MPQHHEFIQHAITKIKSLRPFLPAIAFFAGFTWDSVTMGRMVKSIDLTILMGYYLGAGVVMILQSRDIKPEWQKWLTLLMQFFFGGLFSALVVFYFKSAALGLTLFFVFALCLMLVTNEFLGRKYEQQTLSWTVFTFCGVMYFNFLIPHLVHSIQAIWFYLSCFLSLAIVYGIRWFALAERCHFDLPSGRKLYYRSDLKQMGYPTIVVIFLTIFYQQQLIPPVPLVLKENHICVDLKKKTDSYECQEEKQPFYRSLGVGHQTIHFNQGDKIYNLASIYAPTDIKVELEQRWYLYDQTSDTWVSRGTVPVSMVGGRLNGWRIYSYIKASTAVGKWRVETALKNGAILARKTFILRVDNNTAIEQKTITID